MVVTLRPYQIDLTDRTRTQIRPVKFGGKGRRRVILQAGTGAGKGTMGASITEKAYAKGSRVLLIADRRKLVHQFARDLKKFGVPHGVVMNGNSGHTSAQVVIASRDTLMAWIKNGRDIGQFDLIIIDEAHTSLSNGYQWLLAKFPQAVVLGMTATPARGDGRRLDEYWEAIECAVPTSQLIAEGWLMAPEVYHPEELAAKRAAGEKIVGMAGNPVTQWLTYAKNLPTVAFCQTREEARELLARFDAAGIATEYVDAEADDDERDAILARLKSGRTKVVCCVDLWITGVDLPELACMIAWRPFLSDVQWYQACGRIMRPVLNPETGLPDQTAKPRCVILDHVGAAYGRHPAEDVAWSLDAGSTVAERREKANEDKTKEVNCPACKAMVRAAKACPNCGNPMVAVKQKKAAGAESEGYEATDEMLTLMTPAQEKAQAKAEKAKKKELAEAEKVAKKKAAFERKVVNTWNRVVAEAVQGNYQAGYIIQKFKAKMGADQPPWAYPQLLGPHGLPSQAEYWKWKMKAAEVFGNRPAAPEAA